MPNRCCKADVGAFCLKFPNWEFEDFRQKQILSGMPAGLSRKVQISHNMAESLFSPIPRQNSSLVLSEQNSSNLLEISVCQQRAYSVEKLHLILVGLTDSISLLV